MSTYRLGILGYPLGHTLSPLLHQYLLECCGLTGTYDAWAVPPEQLLSRFDALVSEGVQGFNITIPHKLAIQACLDEIDPLAAMIGAVNTVQVNRQTGHKKGYNTDVTGFAQSLPAEWTQRLPSQTVLMLGAGGSARAVLTALIQFQTKKIILAARRREQLAELQALAKRVMRLFSVTSVIEPVLFHELAALIPDIDGMINTTPVGMWPNDEACPLDETLLHALKPETLVCDLVYRPLKTRFLRDAAARGCRIMNGLDMLIYQGIASFEQWTGQKISPAAMPEIRERLTTALHHPVQ